MTTKFIVSFSNPGDIIYVAVETPHKWNEALVCHKAISDVINKTKQRFFHDYPCGWNIEHWTPHVMEVIEGKCHFTESIYNDAIEAGGMLHKDLLALSAQHSD